MFVARNTSVCGHTGVVVTHDGRGTHESLCVPGGTIVRVRLDVGVRWHRNGHYANCRGPHDWRPGPCELVYDDDDDVGAIATEPSHAPCDAVRSLHHYDEDVFLRDSIVGDDHATTDSGTVGALLVGFEWTPRGKLTFFVRVGATCAHPAPRRCTLVLRASGDIGPHERLDVTKRVGPLYVAHTTHMDNVLYSFQTVCT